MALIQSTSASDVPKKDVISTLQSESVTRAKEIIAVAQEKEIVNDLHDQLDTHY